jgi:hypothetical protein
VKQWERVGAHMLTEGDIVRHNGSCGVVTVVREATHALAAADGAYAVGVSFRHWSPEDVAKFGTHYVHTFTAFPGDTFARAVDPAMVQS